MIYPATSVLLGLSYYIAFSGVLTLLLRVKYTLPSAHNFLAPYSALVFFDSIYRDSQ